MDTDPFRSTYDATDHYWERRDGSLFSSRRIATVAPGDTDYQAFRATGKWPTPYPKDEAGNESVAELQAAIGPRGGFASLESYAAALRFGVEVAGVTAKIGNETVVVSTERTNVPGLQSTLLNVLLKTRQDGDVVKIFADGMPRPATNAEAKAAATAALAHIQDAFNLEGGVVDAIRTGVIRDKAGVEAAFEEPAAA